MRRPRRPGSAPVQWVIDTDVLVRASHGDVAHSHTDNTLRLLGSLPIGGDSLAVDYGYVILREYWGNIRPNSAIGRLLRQLFKNDKILYVSGELASHIERHLTALAFDPDDYVFVAVAHNAPDSLLVAEESDYTTDVVSYLFGEGVSVLDCAEAAREVRS